MYQSADEVGGVIEGRAHGALPRRQELVGRRKAQRRSHGAEAQVPRPQKSGLAAPACRLNPTAPKLTRKRQMELEALRVLQLLNAHERRPETLHAVVPLEPAPTRAFLRKEGYTKWVVTPRVHFERFIRRK